MTMNKFLPIDNLVTRNTVTPCCKPGINKEERKHVLQFERERGVRSQGERRFATNALTLNCRSKGWVHLWTIINKVHIKGFRV